MEKHFLTIPAKKFFKKSIFKIIQYVKEIGWGITWKKPKPYLYNNLPDG